VDEDDDMDEHVASRFNIGVIVVEDTTFAAGAELLAMFLALPTVLLSSTCVCFVLQLEGLTGGARPAVGLLLLLDVVVVGGETIAFCSIFLSPGTIVDETVILLGQGPSLFISCAGGVIDELSLVPLLAFVLFVAVLVGAVVVVATAEAELVPISLPVLL